MIRPRLFFWNATPTDTPMTKWLPALVLCSLPGWVMAQDVAEKAALCASCHGEAGVPIDATIPVISGQTEGYLYVQLRDYKLGNRKNEIMQTVAADLEKADMRALAAHFAAQPWPDLRQPGPSPEQKKLAETAASSAVCTSCHLEGYIGDSTVPRMAGQGHEYLRATMDAFRSGARANNPWMVALMKTYNDQDIEAMAKYLAGL